MIGWFLHRIFCAFFALYSFVCKIRSPGSPQLVRTARAMGAKPCTTLRLKYLFSKILAPHMCHCNVMPICHFMQ